MTVTMVFEDFPCLHTLLLFCLHPGFRFLSSAVLAGWGGVQASVVRNAILESFGSRGPRAKTWHAPLALGTGVRVG
jgi:hypothetical protein